jgi:hypothetical protein
MVYLQITQNLLYFSCFKAYSSGDDNKLKPVLGESLCNPGLFKNNLV